MAVLLSQGIKPTLLIDGPATYEAMLKAIQNAADHINFETFIFEDDDIGRRFADLLMEKQQQGVQVNLIYDSIGSKNTPQAFFSRLRDSGIKVLEFNPVNPLKAQRIDFITHRDHRKILVVDGRIAFTGVLTLVRSIGVTHPLRARARRGATPTCRSKARQWPSSRNFFGYLKTPERADTSSEKLLPGAKATGPGVDSGDRKHSRREKSLYVQTCNISAITFAEKRIHLTNAYFVPDMQTRSALMEAAKTESGCEIDRTRGQ